MEKMLLIDGNSIMNRAFYGIMGSKMLTTTDGKYTNAVYGFLAIMFKNLEDINPDYMAVSFDLKGPTKRHKMYDKYKANRHGMPDELAEQMPMIKQVLEAMNIDIVQKEGYEGDDILGTLARYGEKKGLEVIILSGDRDTFQLVSDNIKIRIPRTKQGKTETEDYTKEKIMEEYGLEPKALIDVKGLQGDSSDNIPGVPGIGPKTAINLIKKYGTIEKLYKKIDEGKDELKGKQKENIIQNREMAILSKELGKIDVKVPLDDTLETLKVEEWDKTKVLELFKEWDFKRYIERFNLEKNSKEKKNIENLFKINTEYSIEQIKEIVNKQQKMIYYFGLQQEESLSDIIKKKIVSIAIFDDETKEAYYLKNNQTGFYDFIKDVFENSEIKKIGYEMGKNYIILKQNGITMKNIAHDVAVASYILNPTKGKYVLDNLIEEYLNISVEEYLQKNENSAEQLTLFQTNNENSDNKTIPFYAYCICELSNLFEGKLKDIEAMQLFKEIDMPTVEVLANMQWNGMHVEEDELNEFGNMLKDGINVLTDEIYTIAGEEFNIKSTKQLGEILFERMGLPCKKKTKSGYSTAEDVLEKLKGESPIIEKIMEYRQLAKLDSTYVEGIKPFINPKTKRIHSFFHQTITATGRISSTEPNLQNIPTRIELGKRLRRVFTPEKGYVYIDADYSQIELRVLAHMSEDENMINAFKKGKDIHKEAASKVLHKPIEEITKQERSNAKAVNFGIVYGISEFGLAEQLGIGMKEAKKYIKQYLEEYSGIKRYMDRVVNQAKEQGYACTMFGRRREIKELASNNYMVRQFGERAAMNTPIQGTAADIMKIAMIKVQNELKNRNMKSKIVLQVHDEMMIEASLDEKEEVKKILKQSMEQAVDLKVPLVADISEAENWYECK